MKNYFALLALAAAFTISSCSNNNDEPAPAPVTNNYNTTIPNPLTGITQGSTDPAVIQFTKDMLTGTNWQLMALVKSIDNTLSFKDLYKDIQDCQRDNSFSFNANGTLTVADHLEWCNASAAQDKTGAWAMTNSASLNITAAGLPEGIAGQATIMQISESTLVLQLKANGFTYVSTYEKQLAAAPELVALINKNWLLTYSKVSYSGGMTIDEYASMDPCEKDNILRFYSNNQVTIDEGPTKCSQFAPQVYTSGFNISGTYLWVNGQQHNILKNTATELELMQAGYDNWNGPYQRTVKYMKQ